MRWAPGVRNKKYSAREGEHRRESPAIVCHCLMPHDCLHAVLQEQSLAPAPSERQQQEGGSRLDAPAAAGTIVISPARPAVLEAAWQQCEYLQRQLLERDAQLAQVLEVLEGGHGGIMPLLLPEGQRCGGESAGQQLARFLKAQMEARDQEVERAQAEASRLGAKLAAAEVELVHSREEAQRLRAGLGEAEAAVAEAQVEADKLRRQNAALLAEAEAARSAANAARQELWALEARASLASYGTPAPDSAASHDNAGDCSISLNEKRSQQQASEYATAQQGCGEGREGGASSFSPVSDVFGSPLGADAAPLDTAMGTYALSACGDEVGSPPSRPVQTMLSFEFQTADEGGKVAQRVQRRRIATDDEGSEAELVSEAAAVARSVNRVNALAADRDQLQRQVHQLAAELHELQQRQSGGSGEQQPRAAHQLAEASRLHAAEERHLRSEVEMLSRKVGVWLRFGNGVGSLESWQPVQYKAAT